MIPLGVLGSSHVSAAGLITDSFDRADGSLGVTDTGETWTVRGGTWVIDGNKARCTTSDTANFFATVPVWASVRVSVALTATTTNPFNGLVARYDHSTGARYSANYNRNRAPGDLQGWQLWRRDTSGVSTEIGFWQTTNPQSAVMLEVEEVESGTQLTYYVDGISRISYLDTDTGRPTGTEAGILKAWGGTDQWWDNFEAEAL